MWFEADGGPCGDWETKGRRPQSLKQQRWSHGLAGGGERDYANANTVASETMAADGGINGLPGANGRVLATSWEEEAEGIWK